MATKRKPAKKVTGLKSKKKTIRNLTPSELRSVRGGTLVAADAKMADAKKVWADARMADAKKTF